MAKITDDQIYGRSALKKGEPWIVPESLAQLESIVKPSWRVFEWGAGGSTIYWAKNCAHVISVEHNYEWIKRVSDLIKRHEVEPWKITLQYQSRYQNEFRAYADSIKPYADGYFNLIFIDGEASSRGWCLNNSFAKLKTGGYLLLDNSDWLKRDLGEQWERADYVARDLKWIGQKGTFNWWTSIVKKL